MKKCSAFILFLLSVFLSSFSQQSIQSPYFTFKGNYTLSDTYSKSVTINYEYSSNDGSTGILIGVTKSISGGDEFLKAIKNSGTFNYTYSTFAGRKCIVAEILMDNQYATHIGFFSGGNGYSIMVVGNSKQKMQNAFTDVKNSFKTK